MGAENDRDRNAVRGDRHRVDVSGFATPASAEAATPPPAEARARAAPRPPSGRRHDCDQRAKASAERRDPDLRLRGAAARRAPPLRARRDNAEQLGDDASQARFAGVREPAILLTTGVVHAATASSWRPQPDALWLALSCAIARSCHRRQTAFTGSTIRPRFDPFSAIRGDEFLQPAPKSAPKHLLALSKVPICRDEASTATGMRTWMSDNGRMMLGEAVPIPRARQPSQHRQKGAAQAAVLPSPLAAEVDAPDPTRHGRFVPDWFRKPARIVPNFRASEATHTG